MIDFRKAFDVVPHNKLITKLHKLGICKHTLLWLIAFLFDRRQCVCLNSAYSTSSFVTRGVIQGSVFGPLLFTMYIKDLPAQCPYCEIMLFADDVKAYKCIRSPSDRTVLQASINNLCRWARDCELDISTDKCYYLQLGYQNLTLIYKLNAEIIAPCTSVVD